MPLKTQIQASLFAMQQRNSELFFFLKPSNPSHLGNAHSFLKLRIPETLSHNSIQGGKKTPNSKPTSLKYLLESWSSFRSSQLNTALPSCLMDALCSVAMLRSSSPHVLASSKWGHITAPNSGDLTCATYPKCHKLASIKPKTSFTAHWNTSATLSPKAESR